MKRDRACFVCKSEVRKRRKPDCHVRSGLLGWRKVKRVHAECLVKRIRQVRAKARGRASNFHARQRRRMLRVA
jgi:hypothetical protein